MPLIFRDISDFKFLSPIIGSTLISGLVHGLKAAVRRSEQD